MSRAGARRAISFGIATATAPQQVAYEELLRVWREADTLPQLEHAWVFDHLLPVGGTEPKRPQHPHPPIVIGGRTTATLRVVARHADVWNIPGGDLGDCIQRSALLDRL